LGPWSASLTSVAIVSGIPLLVTLLLARQEVLLRRMLPQLTAFGAGAVFGAAVGHLIPESLGSGQSPVGVAVGVAVGYAVFWLIERLLAQHDHAHAHGIVLGAPSAHESDSSEAECQHLKPTPPVGAQAVARSRALVPMAFFGDAAHNLVDGVLIAAGFLTNTQVGVLTLIAVALHELPREIGTFSLFVHGGIRPMRAVAYNLLTGVVSMAGAAVTLLVGARTADAVVYLLPVAAGTYLYIAQVVGVASLHDRHHDHAHWSRLGWAGAGAAAMLGAAILG
jgi:zinc and cadmium transporter